MRAWELQAFGLENLRLVERPIPQPGPGQVVLRVLAASLNSRDMQLIVNQYDPNQRLPVVPASDCVGEVVAIGAGVDRVAVGDRVIPSFMQRWIAGERTWPRWMSTVGGHYDGVLQEFCVFEAEAVSRAPAALSNVEAAACGVAASTAWEALVERGGLHAGQTVLVQGTGGVAMFALQFARLHGARVLVTSSSDEKLERCRALGAADGVNYRRNPDWHQAVLELTDNEGVDHIIETAGDLERSVACLRPGGLISLVGYSSQLALGSGRDPDYRYTVGVLPMLLQLVRLQALTAAPRESVDRMLRAIAAGALRPVIGAVHEFTDAPAALRALGAGHAFGKICIRVGD